MYSAQYWNNQGMPANKIVIGMATYGQSWTISGASGVPPPNTPAVGASQVRFNLIKFHTQCKFSCNNDASLHLDNFMS